MPQINSLNLHNCSHDFPQFRGGNWSKRAVPKVHIQLCLTQFLFSVPADESEQETIDNGFFHWNLKHFIKSNR